MLLSGHVERFDRSTIFKLIHQKNLDTIFDIVTCLSLSVLLANTLGETEGYGAG